MCTIKEFIENYIKIKNKETGKEESFKILPYQLQFINQWKLTRKNMKNLLNKEQIKKINDMCKEFGNLALGDNYKNAQIGIDLNNKIKIEDD